MFDFNAGTISLIVAVIAVMGTLANATIGARGRLVLSRKDIADTLLAENRDLRVERDGLKRDVDKLDERVEHSEDRLKALEEENAALKIKLSEAEAYRKHAAEKMAELEQTIIALSKKIARVEENQ